MVIFKEHHGMLVGGGRKPAVFLNFMMQLKDKIREYTNLLYKRSLLACEKGKQVCLS